MSLHSDKFKKMVYKLSEVDRATALTRLIRWVEQQVEYDHTATNLVMWLDRVRCGVSQSDAVWYMKTIFDASPSFQAIVKTKLNVPTANIKALTDKSSRKTIPKKIRAQVWTNAFGSFTQGTCYCCKTNINCLDMWHAGHIVASCNGGSDTVENLRPICVSCNLSMGSEHMETFKNRCYPT
jgi:5-methylcytosine-specific restriction endonuclease McrA